MPSGVFVLRFRTLAVGNGSNQTLSRCNFPEAEHTFRKLGKKGFSGPVQDDVPELCDEGDTVRQEQDASPQDSSIQAAFNALLGVVKTLRLGEVKADYKNLRALVEKKKAAVGTSVPPPTLFDGDDVA